MATKSITLGLNLATGGVAKQFSEMLSQISANWRRFSNVIDTNRPTFSVQRSMDDSGRSSSGVIQKRPGEKLLEREKDKRDKTALLKFRKFTLELEKRWKFFVDRMVKAKGFGDRIDAVKQLGRGSGAAFGKFVDSVGAFGDVKKQFGETTKTIHTGWSKCLGRLTKSKGLQGLSNAFGAFGKTAMGTLGKLGGSIASMAAPFAGIAVSVGAIATGIGAIALAAGVAFGAIKKLCSGFEQLEQASRNATNAFNSGGRMGRGGAGKYKTQADIIASSGSVNEIEAMQSIANARRSGHSLDTKTFDEMLSVSKDASAFLGGEFSHTLNDISGILDGLSVSYDDCKSVGLEFTRAELLQLNAMKQTGKQAQANAIILEKMKSVYQGADEAEASTLSGFSKRIGNLTKGALLDIGAIFAPILKAVYGIVKPLMQVFSIFTDIGKVVGGSVVKSLMIIPNILGALLNGIIQPILSAWNEMKRVISSISGDLDGYESAMNFFKKAFGLIGNILSTQIVFYLKLITGLIKGLYIATIPLQIAFKGLSGIIGGIYEKGKNAFTKLKDSCKSAFSEMKQYVSTKAQEIGEKLAGVWKSFSERAQNGDYGAWTKWFAQAAESLSSKLKSFYETAKSYVLPWDTEKNNTDNKDYVDPRLNIPVNIESAKSMNQRIQKSLIEKNSPGMRQVELLGQILETVSGIDGTAQKQSEESQKTNSNLRQVNQTCGNIRLEFG